jgi:hypothetical protein
VPQTLTVAVALLCCFPSWARSATPDDLPRVEHSLQSGIDWAMRQQPFETGDLWLFSMIQEPATQEMVQATYKKYRGHLGPFEGLLRPGAPSGEMPAQWERLRRNPYSRIGVWLYFAASAPKRGPPPEVLEELLAGEYRDYLSTHQYLALRILTDRRAISGARVRRALEHVLDSIETEQAQDSIFSDLYVERVAILLYGGRAGPRVHEWIVRILAEQAPDHRWTVRQHDFPTLINDLHTSLLSLWSLDQYRRLRGPPGAAAGVTGFQASRPRDPGGRR